MLKKELLTLQKREEYRTLAQVYLVSSSDEGDVRQMKRIFHRILSDYLLYDPVSNRTLNKLGGQFNTSVFEAVAKDDPRYVEKMQAIFLVVYYAVKNRAYNHTLDKDTSVEEINLALHLFEYLEKHAEPVLNYKYELEPLFHSLMVLIFDKILGARVPREHLILKGMQILGIGRMREMFVERRNRWAERTTDKALSRCENTFLYGTYDLKAVNKALAAFDFRLLDIRPKAPLFGGSKYRKFKLV